MSNSVWRPTIFGLRTRAIRQKLSPAPVTAPTNTLSVRKAPPGDRGVSDSKEE